METIAILSRTNLGLRPFEEALSEAGVKYYLLSKSGFWAQPEVRSALAYLSCAVYPSNAAILGAITAPFWPAKYLPKSKLRARLKELGSKEVSYWTLLTKEPEQLVDQKNLESLRNFVSFVHGLQRCVGYPDSIKRIFLELKAWDYYAEDESVDNSPVDNLNELVKIGEKRGKLKDFLDYARKASAASKRKTGVALATCHAAKGMEFDHVYFSGCSEGVIPHIKSTDFDSERNIFYVGCSRAAKKLTLTFSGNPSIFLHRSKTC